MNESVKEVSDSAFEHEVLESEKPVLVDFWAAWCGPCRMLAPTLEAIAEQYSENAAVVKLNVDDNPSTAQAYGIRSIPTLMIFISCYRRIASDTNRLWWSLEARRN